MCINLDSFEILNLELGSKTDLTDGNHQKGCVSFYIKNSTIKNIIVRFSEFYSKGETYDGALIINGEKILVNEQMQPDNVINLFSIQAEHWDDGVEVNYQFQINMVNVEYSWHWNIDTLVPNYINIGID